jgi:hypothetical protein
MSQGSICVPGRLVETRDTTLRLFVAFAGDRGGQTRAELVLVTEEAA